MAKKRKRSKKKRTTKRKSAKRIKRKGYLVYKGKSNRARLRKSARGREYLRRKKALAKEIFG